MTSERAGLQASLGALDSTLDDLRAISSTLGSMDEYFNSHGERVKFIRELPKLAERDIHDLDDACPICQDTFLSVMALEEMAYAMDSPGLPEEQLGVTKLPCGHRFCRKDLSIWTASNNTCPTCRAVLPIPAHPLPAITDVEGILGPEDIQSIRQMQATLEAASRLSQPAPGHSTGDRTGEGTPFSWQVHSGGPEYEYQEDRESFGMYS